MQNEKLTHVVFHIETLGDVEPPFHVIETFRNPVSTGVRDSTVKQIRSTDAELNLAIERPATEQRLEGVV